MTTLMDEKIYSNPEYTMDEIDAKIRQHKAELAYWQKAKDEMK
jgi:hypothetical protein